MDKGVAGTLWEGAAGTVKLRKECWWPEYFFVKVLELPASGFSCTDETKATDLELSNPVLPDTSYEEPGQWGITVIGGGGGGSPRVTKKNKWSFNYKLNCLKNISKEKL